jgi:hypothetical protein
MLEGEPLQFFAIALLHYQDDARLSLKTYGDTLRGRLGAAEYAYFHEMGELPPWGVVIERVEEINGSYLYIHSDWQNAQ